MLAISSTVERLIALTGFQCPHAAAAGLRARNLHLGIGKLLEEVRTHALVPMHAPGAASRAHGAIGGAIAALDAAAVGGETEQQVLHLLGADHAHLDPLPIHLAVGAVGDDRRCRKRVY